MNKVILMGRLARDPEIRTTGGDIKVANFTLAVDRRRRSDGQQNEADFIRCVAFRAQADFAEKWLKQGIKIALTGHIQTGSYEKDGRKVYTTDVIVEELEFAESKKNSDAAASAPAPAQAQASAPAPAGMDGFMNIPDGIDEELPFN